LPFSVSFDGSPDGVCDAQGDSTGLPYVWPVDGSPGYLPANLDVAGSALQVTTTSGLAAGSTNSQANALAVGVDPGVSFTASTTLINPQVAANGSFEQAGLWFGTHRFGQTDYAKLVVVSRTAGPTVQLLVEGGDAQLGVRNVVIPDPSTSTIEMELTADAGALTVSGRFRVNGGAWQSVGSPIGVPARLFTQDQAGVDAALGTDSFVGLFASHRNAPAAAEFRFGDFAVAEISAPPPPPPPPGEVAFTAVTTAVSYKPTALRVGPDGRLYVLDAMGEIRAYQVNANGSVTIQNTYQVLPPPQEGIYTALGLEFDPVSTAQSMTVWISHSISAGENFSEGVLNSSGVTRVQNLTGTPTVTPMITGLPRAIANHAINSIRFGPDGFLYIAMGGQTGAGGPNTEPTEFGTRPEQYYSSALLRADVKRAGGWSPTADGNCATSANDSTGIAQTTPNANCDVQFVSTGLRNTFDFVFADDGFIYGADNALGVAGTVPIDWRPSCQGIVDYQAHPEFDPGSQSDLLQRIFVGGAADPKSVSYRGHPNPARADCVFFNGAFQTALFGTSVTPPSRYVPELVKMNSATANEARSFNGIVQYQAATFGGALEGDLILTAFAGPQTTGTRPQGVYRVDPTNPTVPQRITVTAGGVSYAWNQPLPLVELGDGRLVVGEFRGRTSPSARLVVLTPATSGGGGGGTWATKAPMPTGTLDGGSGALNGRLYVVGGKTSATNRVTTMRVYDPETNSWSTGASVPGPAREDIAVAAHDGQLYAFGGADSSAFLASSSTAARYDPVSDTWSDTAVADMVSPVTGAAAISWNGKLYVLGGLDSAGNSTTAVRIYDPATNSWSNGPQLPQARDNAGVAVFGGHLYVFGGRNRQSGSGPTTATVWRLTSPAGAWESRASMPAPRRAFVTGAAVGKVQLFGGESDSSAALTAVHEYDPGADAWTTLSAMPTGRHGPAGDTIAGISYVVGGATTAGAGSITPVNEAFTR
jgi:N-acetylneuraminic acid mutarotase/glucose/arabinose dehydrogenase